MLYECPKCQSQLKYWEEFVFHKERRINKQTGKLNKKVISSNEIELELELEQHGISCTKCDFEYYGNENGNDITYQYLNKILEKRDD